MLWRALSLTLLCAATCGADSRVVRVRDPRFGGRTISQPAAGVQLNPFPPFEFAFAPADGTGLSAGCACTNVTAADGTPLTVSRASVANCTKRSWWSGIMPGDVVECPADKPIIEPGGDGGGQLRLLVERSGTNYILDPLDFTTGNWIIQGGGGSDPCTVSPPDAGLAPNGQNQATRLICPATEIGQYARVLQFAAVPAANASSSLYVRSYGGATTVPLVCADNVAGFYSDISPGAFAAGYARGKIEGLTNGISYCLYGNVDSTVAHPAIDALIWAPQSEIGNAVSSFMLTSRAATTASLPVFLAVGADLSVDTSALVHATPTTAAALSSLSAGPTHQLTNRMNATTTGLTCEFKVAAVDTLVSNLTPFTADAVNRTRCEYDGDAGISACLNGSCADAGIATPSRAFDTLWLGTIQTADSQPNAHLGPVVVSSSAIRDVFLYGDGIVNGFYFFTALPENIVHANKGNSVSTTNYSLNGDRIEDCAEKWASTMASLKTAGAARAARAYPMVQCGFNGMNDGGTDAGQISDILKFMLWSARDAGVSHAMVSSISPRYDDYDLWSRDRQVSETMRSFSITNSFLFADTYAVLNGAALFDGGGCDPTLLYCDPSYNHGVGWMHLQDAGQVAETANWILQGVW